MSPLPEQPFTAWVGIDWADTKHDICVQAAGESRRESGCIAHQVAAIDEWANALHRRFGGPLAVALERFADDLLGVAVAIHFGGIDHGVIEFDGVLHRLELLGAPAPTFAHAPGTDPEHRHLRAGRHFAGTHQELP